MRRPASLPIRLALSLAAIATAAAADWIGYGGAADGANLMPAPPLVSDLSAAKLLWSSADPIPDGRAADGSDPPAEHLTISGGYASPLIAGNLAIITYYVPVGEAYCKGALAKTRIAAPAKADPQAAWQALQQRGKQAVGYAKFLIEADDVIHAIDMKTGATVWKRVIPKGGINFCRFNKGGTGATAVISDGMVVALGTAGRVYGVDLANGELRWTGSIGKRAEVQESLRAAALKKGEMPSFNRDFNGWLAAVDGVVAVCDNAHYKLNTGEMDYSIQDGLVGLSAKDGKTLWTVPGCLAGKANGPIVWRSKAGGRFLAVAESSSDTGTTCIEARSGKVLWTSKLPGKPILSALCVGDELFAIPAGSTAGKDKTSQMTAGQLAGYSLSESGATRRWELPASTGAAFCVAVDGQVVWALGRKADGLGRLSAVDRASGDLLGGLDTGCEANGEHGNTFLAILGDHVLFIDSNNAGNVKIAAATKDPRNPALLPGRLAAPGGGTLAGAYCVSIVPALDGQGRLVTRSPTALVCYDLKR
jgi:outer membrane protein assembly factor BamB